jgi:hypothetical protein
VADYLADPTDVDYYGWDWADRLDTGETISVSTWTVPSGITQTTPAPSIAGSVTTLWLTGGTLGQKYTVTNHITTNQGRQFDRSFVVQILDR